MKYRRGVIFICLIICLFSIASVYASEVNETVMANENQNDELIEVENQDDDVSASPDENNGNTEVIGVSNNEDNNTDKLNTPENSEVLSNSISFSGTTFTELQTIINNAHAGDVITLKKDIKQDKTSEITIDKSIRIEGNGHTINALGKSRIFNVIGDNIVINNINFINSKTSAIYWNGVNGTVSHSSFVNNTATNDDGGAIYSTERSSVSVSHSSFVNNTALWGGAIYNAKSVYNCSFVKNSASYYGGAIYENSPAVIGNCSFVSNFISAPGGSAISCGYNRVVIGNCSFVNNYGDYAISGDNRAVIGNCSFVNNSAGSIDDADLVYNCSFVNNTGGGRGKVIYNCSFVNNTGSFSVYERIYNCSFVNNTATSGGAINIYNPIVVSNCSFVSNSATNGGAIYIFLANYRPVAVVVSNCSFVNNSATYGGAIYNVAWQGIQFTSNCSFVNNTATYGGAIHIRRYYPETPGALVEYYYSNTDNCSFVNNTATYGGAININTFMDGDTIAINIGNCSFMNNSKYEIYNRVKLSLDNNSCSNFIYTNYNQKSSIISQSYAVVLNNSTINSEIGHNTLSFVLKDDNNNTIITNAKMNFLLPDGTKLPATLDYDTGVFYADCIFNEEGVYQISSDFNDVPLPENLAVLKGSVNIMTDFEYLQQLINNAPEGGVINLTRNYIYNTRLDNITKGILIDKRLTINGNGYAINALGKSRIFDVNSDDVVLNNINFINANASNYYGGSVCWNGDNGVLANCSFVNSTADCGGSVCWNGDNGVLANCSFVNSTAANKGGSIFTGGNQNSIHIENNLFNISQSKIGGVIYSAAITHLFNNEMHEGLAENGSYIYNANIIGTVYVRILNNDTTVTKREAPITINATLTDDMANPISGGSIIFIIEDNQYAVESVQGHASYTYVFDKIDSYYISGNYTENRRYVAIVSGATINVEGITTNLNVTGLDVKIGENTTISATLTDDLGNPLYNRTIFVTFNGETINRTTNDDGIITLFLATSDLAGGFHEITVAFGGDNVYNSTKFKSYVNVKFNGVIKISMIDGLKLTAILTDEKGNPIVDASVSYTLDDGETVNVTTNENGEFVCDAKSNCVLTMNYSRDSDTSCSASIILKNLKPVQKTTVIEVPSTMKKTAVDYKAGEKGTMFYFYLRDADGKGLAKKAIKIGIFDKIYTVKTDENGRGGLQINIANANYYTYAITFLGDDDYKASFAVCSLEIVKKPITITPAKTSYTFKASAKTKTITATLKSSNSYIPKGKQVTLTIAGKTFKATIGDKGQISLNVGSITAKGTYKVAIKFAGTNTYSATTSKTITVKIS